MDYQKLLSPTVMGIKPSGIRKFFDIANTMEDVISLGVGEPDFPTPWEIRKAGILSLEGGKTRYTSNRGLEVLREEIGNYVKRKYGVAYDPVSEILVTVGGSEAIDACIRAIACPGDEIIIPQPSYVCYEPITALCGCKPVIIETKAENSFKLTPEELKAAITPRTKALILPYPCNPTGAIMERADLEAIAAVLKVAPARLLGWGEGAPLPHADLLPLSRRAVPLVGHIACGEPILAEEEFCGYELAGGDVDADFCLRAKGDSMIGARIHDGDIVFVRRQESVENGEIAVVIIDDEATLKRVYYDRAKGKLILTPENPRYAPLSFEGEELSRIKILGRAVALQTPLR